MEFGCNYVELSRFHLLCSAINLLCSLAGLSAEFVVSAWNALFCLLLRPFWCAILRPSKTLKALNVRRVTFGDCDRKHRDGLLGSPLGLPGLLVPPTPPQAKEQPKRLGTCLLKPAQTCGIHKLSNNRHGRAVPW